MSDLLVRGGLVFGSDGFRELDVLVSGGRVAAVGSALGPATSIADAGGLWVLPGAIDAHVHSREPGFPEKEDWGTLTAAAAAGGVTTVADMPNTMPCTDSGSRLEEKSRLAAARALVDFALWGIARASSTTAQVESLAEAGAVGLKAFLGYAVRPGSGQVLYAPGSAEPGLEPPPRYADLERLAPVLARLGLPLAAHCEDPDVLAQNVRSIGTYADLLASRPALAEARAVAALGAISRASGARVRTVHLASGAGLLAAVKARSLGALLDLETCPQYLWLCDQDYEVLDGPLKMFPLVRTAADREALRQGLRAGLISSVGTDHAPHTDAEKVGPALAEVAPGSPGVQTLYLSSLELGRLGGFLQTAIRAVTENPARELGLLPRKGVIAPGADADLVLVDPAAETVVRPERMFSKQRHGVFEGRRFEFGIRAVYVRGELAFDGKVPLGPPRGRLVRPRPS